jgi:hypothetical protein
MTVAADNQAVTCGGGVPAPTCKHAGLAHGGASAAFAGGPAATANGGSAVGGYSITQDTLAGTGDYTVATCNGGTLALSAAPHLAGTATSHFGGNELAKFTDVGAERVPHARLGHVKAGSLFGTAGGEAGGRGGGAPPDRGGQREPEGDLAAQEKTTQGSHGGGPPPPRPPHDVDNPSFAPTGLTAAGPLPEVTRHLPLSLTLFGAGLGGRHAPAGGHPRGTPRGPVSGGMGGPDRAGDRLRPRPGPVHRPDRRPRAQRPVPLPPPGDAPAGHRPGPSQGRLLQAGDLGGFGQGVAITTYRPKMASRDWRRRGPALAPPRSWAATCGGRCWA